MGYAENDVGELLCASCHTWKFSPSNILPLASLLTERMLIEASSYNLTRRLITVLTVVASL